MVSTSRGRRKRGRFQRGGGRTTLAVVTRDRPLLEGALPALRVPWIRLFDAPTPVETCDAIAPYLGRSGVFMKRDDLISPLYGGNKVRRYEYVLAEAKARGAKRLVTVGGLGSTQVLATALFGRELGFEVEAVLFDQPVTDFVRTSLRSFVAAGARLVYGGGYARTAWYALRAWRAARDAYFIFPGAPNPRANLGYVDAMLELGEQVARGEAPRPDAIVLPTGSSGTLAALALGAAYLGWPTEVVGVRITSALACNRATVSAIVAATDRFLARDPRWSPQRSRARWSLWGGAVGKGYGYPTAEAVEGAAQLATLTGAAGEVTYSGKALAGLRELLRGRFRRANVLLWNTLSTPRPPATGDVPTAFEHALGDVEEG